MVFVQPTNIVHRHWHRRSRCHKKGRRPALHILLLVRKNIPCCNRIGKPANFACTNGNGRETIISFGVRDNIGIGSSVMKQFLYDAQVAIMSTSTVQGCRFTGVMHIDKKWCLETSTFLPVVAPVRVITRLVARRFLRP